MVSEYFMVSEEGIETTHHANIRWKNHSLTEDTAVEIIIKKREASWSHLPIRDIVFDIIFKDKKKTNYLPTEDV